MSHKRQDPEFYEPFGDDTVATNPPSRGNARPSLTEIGLAINDRKRDPSLRPGMHPADAFARELDARKADNF